MEKPSFYKKIQQYWRRIVHNIEKYTYSKYAEPLLYTVALTEAFIFPIPPDVLLVPMVLLQEKKALRYALCCTVFSVVGGMVGYAIGSYAMQSLGNSIVAWYNLESSYAIAMRWFDIYGVVAVILAGFTPIPYKLCTVLCGMLSFSFPSFVIASFVGRGSRFFLLASLPYLRRTSLGRSIEKNLFVWCTVLLCILCVGYVLWKSQ